MDTSRHPADGGADARIARMIRVDQAGEYGAQRIYAGQLAVLRDTPASDTIREMATKEREHLDRFDKLLLARRVRPTVLAPVWHVAGFALGAATALMGKKVAMACTEAVEEVIVDHYAVQAARLGDEDTELAAAINDALADETDHKARAIDEGARDAPCHGALTATVKAGARAAIWLSERV
jgi:ubiquinone biosynthesis monooxygenase Coq7